MVVWSQRNHLIAVAVCCAAMLGSATAFASPEDSPSSAEAEAAKEAVSSNASASSDDTGKLVAVQWMRPKRVPPADAKKLAAMVDKVSAETFAGEILPSAQANTALKPKMRKLAGRCQRPGCWRKLGAAWNAKFIVGIKVLRKRKEIHLEGQLVEVAKPKAVAKHARVISADPEVRAGEIRELLVALHENLSEDQQTRLALKAIDDKADAVAAAEAEPATDATQESAEVSAQAEDDTSVAVNDETDSDRAQSTGGSQEPTPGWLGVGFRSAAAGTDRAGALIVRVNESGPGEAAGIRAGDVVVSFASNDIKDGRDLLNHLRQTVAGQQVPVTILRDGVEIVLEVSMAAKPTKKQYSASAQQ